MQDRPYFNLFDQICRSNGWVLGSDKGEMVLGIPQQDGSQQSVVINDFQDSSGQPAIRMWSPVAPTEKVPADQAMSVNAQLPHGHLAVQNNQVVMMTTRLVGLLNQAELSTLLSVLSYYAAFYRGHYSS